MTQSAELERRWLVWDQRAFGLTGGVRWLIALATVALTFYTELGPHCTG